MLGNIDTASPFTSTASCIITGEPNTDNNNLLSGGILKAGVALATIQGEQEFPVVGATGLTGWTVTAPIGGSTQFPASLQALAICFDNPDP